MRRALDTMRGRYPPGTPFLSMAFSTDGDNFVYEPHPLLPMTLQMARASSRDGSGKEPLFDDGEPLTERKAVKELNDFIRLDKENVVRARGVRPIHWQAFVTRLTGWQRLYRRDK